MKDLEFTCTQKCAHYKDGWDHPESITEATDSSGNLYHCAECDCDDNCCCNEETNDCSWDQEGCSCPDDEICHEEDCTQEETPPDIPVCPEKGNLVCSIYEKTCSCEESRGPSNVNDETGWHKSCTTTIRIVKKYQPK